jgi:hypothetical protein
MGKIVLDETYTLRCYTIHDGGLRDQGLMTETWDEPNNQRTYDVTLRKDNRFVPDGCMIHTALHGTAFTQWISAVGSENMNF